MTKRFSMWLFTAMIRHAIQVLNDPTRKKSGPTRLEHEGGIELWSDISVAEVAVGRDWETFLTSLLHSSLLPLSLPVRRRRRRLLLYPPSSEHQARRRIRRSNLSSFISRAVIYSVKLKCRILVCPRRLPPSVSNLSPSPQNRAPLSTPISFTFASRPFGWGTLLVFLLGRLENLREVS